MKNETYFRVQYLALLPLGGMTVAPSTGGKLALLWEWVLNSWDISSVCTTVLFAVSNPEEVLACLPLLDSSHFQRATNSGEP